MTEKFDHLSHLPGQEHVLSEDEERYISGIASAYVALGNHWVEEVYMHRVIAWTWDSMRLGPTVKGRLGRMLRGLLASDPLPEMREANARIKVCWVEHADALLLPPEIPWLGVEECFLLAGASTGFWVDKRDGRLRPLCEPCLASGALDGLVHLHWFRRDTGALVCSNRMHGKVCKGLHEFYPFARQPGLCWSCVEGILDYWGRKAKGEGPPEEESESESELEPGLEEPVHELSEAN
jgi:hypothetical protein